MRSNGPVSEKSRRLTRLSLRVELARVCRSPCRLTRPRSSRRATDSRPSASLFGALSSDLARGYAALVPRRRDPQRPVAGSRAHQPRSDGGVVPAVSKGVGERGDVHARQQGREAAAERRSGRRDGGGRDGATVKASLGGGDVRTPRCHSAQAQTRLDRFAPVVRGMLRPGMGTDTDSHRGSTMRARVARPESSRSGPSGRLPLMPRGSCGSGRSRRRRRPPSGWSSMTLVSGSRTPGPRSGRNAPSRGPEPGR